MVDLLGTTLCCILYAQRLSNKLFERRQEKEYRMMEKPQEESKNEQLKTLQYQNL